MFYMSIEYVYYFMTYPVMRSVVVTRECIGSYIVDKTRLNEIFVLNF